MIDISRNEMQSKIELASKRAILNELRILRILKRVKVTGQSSTTAYKISDDYYKEYPELLYIYQNQILVGYLGYDYQTYYFSYDTDYLLAGKFIAKFQMLFDFEIYSQESCFVDFEECLPEGIDRKILIDKIGNATEFFLLAHNDYSKNDLIFSTEPLKFSSDLKSQSYLMQKEKILGKNRFSNILKYEIDVDDISLFPTLYINDEEELRHIRTMSLSGYQHKLQVVIDNNSIRTPKNDFKKAAKKISKLENIDFYLKEKVNAQDKKIKIKAKTTLDKVMMKHFDARCKTLKHNGWFDKLEI